VLFCYLYLYIFSVLFFQNQFVVDDVSKIIKEAIESTIGGNAYQHDKVNNWTGSVVETCLSVLTNLKKPYKYIGKFSYY
jgi:dynein light chain Tctex-type 1